MSIICNLTTVPHDIPNPIITIGNFDGVHCAHQKIFKKVIERAKDLRGTSLAITFEPHPIKVMFPTKAQPLITLLEQKKELIIKQGVDILIVIEFSAKFSAISAKDFVKDILVDKLSVKEVVVGYDYAFGYKRQGNIESLREMGSLFSFTVKQVDPVYVGKTLVSSTSIRNLVMEGNVVEAKKLLGRNYQIRGEVIKGMNRGSTLLGYPTANLRLTDELIPKEGVYIVLIDISGKRYQGLTNIGYNPTFKNKELSVETYIFDLSARIVKKKIKIDFLSRLRDEITFTSSEELSKQIHRDVNQARKFFDKKKDIL